MASLTATVSETRANFSKIAESVCRTGKPVTVFRNSKPWVLIAPISTEESAEIPFIDWSTVDVLCPDPETGQITLPKDAYAAEDDGLYDDLV